MRGKKARRGVRSNIRWRQNPEKCVTEEVVSNAPDKLKPTKSLVSGRGWKPHWILQGTRSGGRKCVVLGHVCAMKPLQVRTVWMNWFALPNMHVLGIELRLPGLAAITFTY